MVYGVEPTDPVSFAVAGLVLVAIAVAATLAPARRAARTEPGVVLRGE
jgi:ABC-type lipoprotein release transport system permease subunit